MSSSMLLILLLIVLPLALTSTENRIAFARQAFNDHVMQYNTTQQSFPNILVAQLLGVGPAQPFHVEHAEAREPVRVSFE